MREGKGSILFDGEDITGMPTSELLKRGLLYIPQKNNLFSDLTVKENLEMAGLTLKSSKVLRQRIAYVLAIFPILSPILDRVPMKLSGGERQLLALAMASLHKPKMMLLDEPFAGLSEENAGFVKENLITLNEDQRLTLFIVEHRVKESYQISKKIIGLKLGKVYSITQVNTNFDSPSFQDVFV